MEKLSNIDRRGFLRGLTGILAAPALVRVSSLMPVKARPLLIEYDINYIWFDDVRFFCGMNQYVATQVIYGFP